MSDKKRRFRSGAEVPMDRQISSFERGLVNWIEEHYNPDHYLSGSWHEDKPLITEE